MYSQWTISTSEKVDIIKPPLYITMVPYTEAGEVPPPPPVNERELTPFSAVVRWNPPSDSNGVILRYTVNYVAVSNTSSQEMGRRRRQTSGASAECILGGQRNVNRNMTVDGSQTSATLTELSEYSSYCWCKLWRIRKNPHGLVFGSSGVQFSAESLVSFFPFLSKLTSRLFLLQNNSLHLCYLTVIVHPWIAPGTAYEFRVQAETAVGRGPFSSSRPFTTSENGMIMIVAHTVI